MTDSAENDAPVRVLRWLRDEAAALLHAEICRCGQDHHAHGRVYLEMAGTAVRALLPLIDTRVIPPGRGSDAAQ